MFITADNLWKKLLHEAICLLAMGVGSVSQFQSLFSFQRVILLSHSSSSGHPAPLVLCVFAGTAKIRLDINILGIEVEEKAHSSVQAPWSLVGLSLFASISQIWCSSSPSAGTSLHCFKTGVAWLGELGQSSAEKGIVLSSLQFGFLTSDALESRAGCFKSNGTKCGCLFCILIRKKEGKWFCSVDNFMGVTA